VRKRQQNGIEPEPDDSSGSAHWRKALRSPSVTKTWLTPTVGWPNARELHPTPAT